MMDKTVLRKQPNKQKKYRQRQSQQGLVRFELQINAEAKARFEQLVEAVAEEYETPWDKRQRLALARNKVFNQIIEGTVHEFRFLKQQIDELKQEIAALSPTFFTSTGSTPTPLPEGIRSLPDDPAQLKSIIATLHHDCQHSQQTAQKYQHAAEQFEKLYDASSRYNQDLLLKLQQYEASTA